MLLPLLLNLGSSSAPYVDSNEFYITVTGGSTSGGGWESYLRFEAQAYRRRRLREEAEQLREQAIEEAAEDARQAEIARLIHERLAREQEQEELSRLSQLVESSQNLTGVSERVQTAFAKAKAERTFSRLQALQRELIKAQELEEMALLMILLADE